jgi:hypothetical protein
VSVHVQPEYGVAIAKRTGERRLLTREAYLELDRRSDARWEFFSIPTDGDTGAPATAGLERFGFTPGEPTLIPGDLAEVEPGRFRRADPT